MVPWSALAMRVTRFFLAILLTTGAAVGATGRMSFAQTVAATESAAAPRFESGVRGAIVEGQIGTSRAGDALMFELGAETAGLRSLKDRRWILLWDVRAAGRGGYLANQHPYLFLIGAREVAWAEGGYRFRAAGRFSPYLGARLGNEGHVMVHPSLALSAFDTINDVDRVGGTALAGSARIDFGASLLDDRRSLLLVAFVQEELRSALVNTPAQAFTEGGLGARLDVASGTTLQVEGLFGLTPTRRNSYLGFTDRTTRVAGTASVRKTFRNGMWIAASMSLERDSDHVVYDSGGAIYDSKDAPRFDLAILYGVPLGRRK